MLPEGIERTTGWLNQFKFQNYLDIKREYLLTLSVRLMYLFQVEALTKVSCEKKGDS